MGCLLLGLHFPYLKSINPKRGGSPKTPYQSPGLDKTRAISADDRLTILGPEQIIESDLRLPMIL